MRLSGMRPVPMKIFLILMALGTGGGMGFTMNRPETVKIFSRPGRYPVMVIAHRGFSGSAPENTLSSFKKAIEVGSDMIELDVHLSKDGEVVVIHDDTLERTTDGKGKVADRTLQELKRLDAGFWFGAPFSGERIPALREVLNLARGQILVNIELKAGYLGPYTLEDLADRAFDEVEKAGMVNYVIFSSFEPSALERVGQKNSRIPLALITNKPWSTPQEVTKGKAFPLLNCRKSVLTKVNITKAREEGFKVNVYTLNTEEEMEGFLSWGVDGIITNYPDRLIHILQKRSR